MSQSIRSKKGFTLVELVVVIAILAILAAIAIPAVMNVIGKANESSDASNAKTMESALKVAAAIDAPTNPVDTNADNVVSGAEAEAYLSGSADINVAQAKQTGFSFWVNGTTLAVRAASATPGTGWDQIPQTTPTTP